MGMTLTKEKHNSFHQDSPDLSPKQHQALMKRLGVTREEDEEWHRTHFTLAEQRAMAKTGMKAVDALVLGEKLVGWCEKQGWIARQRGRHFATKEGAGELRERFGIEV